MIRGWVRFCLVVVFCVIENDEQEQLCGPCDEHRPGLKRDQTQTTTTTVWISIPLALTHYFFTNKTDARRKLKFDGLLRKKIKISVS